ncbi:TetR/AcrR family transcriptional regulator [Actinokineospora sp. NBRC 105648]|uniref:TetR/AcrR family transcriptional regulator n=1 Tax=Actinokineospora sp. NBRC 105648 TaxID=3032206 RepID=UPI0024A55E24|nr:TetR/AcrR family transcriptional regulator [Actinokineospora sp. NBRC 105648]GLZ42569.1 putative transcriptional regulator, TetR family protein [Actinokineospora sp. NBRC 105648]
MTAARSRVPFAEAARTLLRATLLDAAGDLLRERAWSGVTMADVAAAAGVSRQTLYKEFGSRQGFAQEYILRETDRFLTAVEAAIAAHVAEPERALAAAMEVFLTSAAAEPLIKAIVAGDDDGLLGLVTNRAGPVLSGATARLADCLITSWPTASAPDLRFVAENLVRLAVSHAASPSGTAAHTARAVSAVFGPYLESLGAQG